MSNARPFLDPGLVQLSLNDTGGLCLTLSGKAYYPHVKASLAFPRSAPDGFVELFCKENGNRTIGMIRNLSALDTASRCALTTYIDHYYAVPMIKRIHAITHSEGVSHLDVETDRGRTKFAVRDPSMSVEENPENTFIFCSADGRRFLFRDSGQLDRRSKRLIEFLL